MLKGVTYYNLITKEYQLNKPSEKYTRDYLNTKHWTWIASVFVPCRNGTSSKLIITVSGEPPA